MPEKVIIGNAELWWGDCLEVLPLLPENSIDSIVTDPPYGLSFMGKDWDHGIPGVHFWIEALRVAKPGAYLLAFGGTRTFHRLVVAIEDAGWEIRDCVMWLYGSGFPKSLDISKAIDRAAGAEREVVGVYKDPNGRDYTLEKSGHDGYAKTPLSMGKDAGVERRLLSAPATEAAKQWQGWGTALKPAHEDIIVAMKPFTLPALIDILVQKIGGAICQLPLYAKDAGRNLLLNQNESAAASNSALWIAVEKCNTLADLYVLMDTLPSESEIPLSLNTGLLWLNCLGDLSQAMSMFTTEMESSLKMDLKTLNSLSSMSTVATITQELTQQLGIGLNASTAASIFNAVNAKLDSILIPSAPGLVTSKGEQKVLHPDFCQVIMARKPFKGTVAENVLEHGTGGINIDGCRVDFANEKDLESAKWGRGTDILGGNYVGATHSSGKTNIEANPIGRWPANLIHDGSDEVLECFLESLGAQGDIKGTEPSCTGGEGTNCFGKYNRIGSRAKRNDEGSASRFFYCAKASKSDRNEGCHDIEAQIKDAEYRQPTGNAMVDRIHGCGKKSSNHHPTVKPTDLMRYLCRLVTPPGGTVLDMFMGSGSTGKAAEEEGFKFIGIDLEREYLDISVARNTEARKQMKLSL